MRALPGSPVHSTSCHTPLLGHPIPPHSLVLSSEATQQHGDCREFGLRLLFLFLEPGQALKAFPKSTEDGSSLVCSMASPHLLLMHT